MAIGKHIKEHKILGIATEKWVETYVDELFDSWDWQESVIDIVNALPANPSDGDRYIVSSGTYDEYIAEFDTTISGWDYAQPDEGFACWVEDENRVYVYNDQHPAGEWSYMGNFMNHNLLMNLAVGDVHTQYTYHSGRAGGQDIYGGTGAGESLNLYATTGAGGQIYNWDDTTVSGNLEVTGNLGVDGHVEIEQTLEVDGNADFDGDVEIGGDLNFNEGGPITTDTNGSLSIIPDGYGNTAVHLEDELQAMLVGNSTPVGTFTNCTVGAASAIIQHADIDTGTAVGDCVQVCSGTGVTTGFYRLITVGANQVTVDRNVSGAGGADIICKVYRDVIAFHATDGTNGNWIRGFSHQDKPLQIGGDELAATGHSLGGEDVLFGGKTEFNDAAYFDGAIDFDSSLTIKTTEIDDTDSPYSLLTTDYLLFVDTTNGAVTIDLPSAQVLDGRKIEIKDSGGNFSVNNCIITPQAELIDGNANLVINADYAAVELVSDGSNWFTL